MFMAKPSLSTTTYMLGDWHSRCSNWGYRHSPSTRSNQDHHRITRYGSECQWKFLVHSDTIQDQEPRLLTFSALKPVPFESIKVRSSKPLCPACGTEGGGIGEIQKTDYVQLCGGPTPDWEQRGLVEGALGLRTNAKVKTSYAILLRDAIYRATFMTRNLSTCWMNTSKSISLMFAPRQNLAYARFLGLSVSYLLCIIGT